MIIDENKAFILLEVATAQTRVLASNKLPSAIVKEVLTKLRRRQALPFGKYFMIFGEEPRLVKVNGD